MILRRFCFVVTFLFPLVVSSQTLPKVDSRTPFSIGETMTFRSSLLGEDRVINLYLPQGYADSSHKRYPVIYLLDGSVDEDFIHIAGLVQFGSFSWINMVPESIVVGIGNVDRQRDFTFPTENKRDKKDFPTTGGSGPFIDFISNELQPLIEQEFRTTSTRTLIGQSLGGLLATEILFTQPDLFDNYIIVSPSLWWDDESLLEVAPQSYDSEKSIYVAVGKEGKVMERTARQLFVKLQERGIPHTKLYFEFLEEQDHGDALHLAVYNAFEKIFSE